MKFQTVAEAFNYYRNFTLEQIEQRAAEIRQLVDTDPTVDVNALNIELDGLREAKANLEQRAGQQRGQFQPVPGASMSFNASPQPEGDIFASAEYRSAFFKHLLGQKLTEVESRAFTRAMQEAEKRADSFNTTGNSAAVLPTQTLNEVISKARTMGGVISACRAFNIPANLSVPIGTPSSKAAWHSEGAAVDSESANVSNVSFAAYEILKVFSLSVAARRMSVPAFERYVVDELTNCVLGTIADALVNGTGQGQGTGVLNGVTWDSSNSFTWASGGVPAWEDYTKALAMLKRGYSAGAAWVMNHATLLNTAYALKDSNGRPLFINDAQNQSVGFILGRPVIVDDYMPDNTIILGNFQYMGYNIPDGIMVEVSRDSSFKSGLIDYRAMAIADTKPLVGEAFVKLSEATA
ncbi:phage major capsid protein [Alicyclobacillus shizuokensis]|uniref:phage major capsid protein n=1 Tax=Alicyclobacillus shizuokensis TaxID=392014 RepID=UPI000830A311|nr:phage major capsid protein [Alicyclobacillus shizuokensis]